MTVGAQPHSNTLSWTWAQGTGDMAAGFHVKKSSTAGTGYTTIATVPYPGMTYIDTDVKAGEVWYYVVTAYNAGGESSPTNEVTCTTPFQAPATPTGLSGTSK